MKFKFLLLMLIGVQSVFAMDSDREKKFKRLTENLSRIKMRNEGYCHSHKYQFSVKKTESSTLVEKYEEAIQEDGFNFNLFNPRIQFGYIRRSETNLTPNDLKRELYRHFNYEARFLRKRNACCEAINAAVPPASACIASACAFAHGNNAFGSYLGLTSILLAATKFFEDKDEKRLVDESVSLYEELYQAPTLQNEMR